MYSHEIAHVGSGRGPAGGRQVVLGGLEQAFLNEMLKYAGPQPQAAQVTGGIGEDAFHSLYVEQLSQALSQRISLKI